MDYRFENIFAWIQDERVDEMIIGRDTVFDLFDIEFRQREEKVILRPTGKGKSQKVLKLRVTRPGKKKRLTGRNFCCIYIYFDRW